MCVLDKSIKVRIEKAKQSDLPAIISLLQTVKLSPDGIEACLQDCIIAKDEDKIIGSAALEIYGNAALLRSLAVAKSWQGKGISLQLYERILEIAREQGVQKCYLMTETVPAYFEKHGFKVMNRNEFPENMKSSIQFTKVCPESAIAMMKEM